MHKAAQLARHPVNGVNMFMQTSRFLIDSELSMGQ
jgi:hypothetical protein